MIGICFPAVSAIFNFGTALRFYVFGSLLPPTARNMWGRVHARRPGVKTLLSARTRTHSHTASFVVVIYWFKIKMNRLFFILLLAYEYNIMKHSINKKNANMQKQ